MGEEVSYDGGVGKHLDAIVESLVCTRNLVGTDMACECQRYPEEVIQNSYRQASVAFQPRSLSFPFA